MTGRRVVFGVVFVLLVLSGRTSWASPDDVHWSREFAKPAQITKMGVGTGMSDGGGKPTVTAVRWHGGKLYMAGSWEPGVSGDDPTVRLSNDYWHVWSWSPVKGYEVQAHFHSSQGGPGPNGKILDFLFLPDAASWWAAPSPSSAIPEGTAITR